MNMKLFYSNYVINYADLNRAEYNKTPNQFIFDGTNTEELITILSTHVCHCCEYYGKANYRTKMKFKTGYAIALDFEKKIIPAHTDDNGKLIPEIVHDDSSIEEFLECSFAKKYNFILYTSKSHKDGSDCFHVIFFLLEPIRSLNEYTTACKSLRSRIKEEGIKMDDGANYRLMLNPSRKSGSESVSEHFKWLIQKDKELLSSEILIEKDTIKSTSQKSLYPYSSYNNNTKKTDTNMGTNQFGRPQNKINNTFEMIKIEQKQNILYHFCAWLNNDSIDFRFGEWATIGMVLNTYLGPETGLLLFRYLSVGWRNQTQEYVDKNFLEIIKNQEEDVKLSAIFSFAQKHKYEFIIPILTTLRKTQRDPNEAELIYQFLMEDLSSKNNWSKCSIHRGSKGLRARSFLLKYVTHEGEIGYKKLTITELKDRYQEHFHVVRDVLTGAFSQHLRDKVGESCCELQHLLIYSITEYIEKGYITPTEITAVRNLIKEKISQKLLQAKCSKSSIIENLVKVGILESSEQRQKWINGKNVRYYKCVSTKSPETTSSVEINAQVISEQNGSPEHLLSSDDGSTGSILNTNVIPETIKKGKYEQYKVFSNNINIQMLMDWYTHPVSTFQRIRMVPQVRAVPLNWHLCTK